MKRYKLKVGIQLLAVIMVSAGITFEVIYKAPLGYLAITVGALIFAISTKMKGE